MQDNDWKVLLTEGVSRFNIDLTAEQMQLFYLYLREVLAWNTHINITAIKTVKGIIIKHFIDSLTVIEHLPLTGELADLGSGGGFPGIPIKIARPALDVTLIEATRKKVTFLRHVIRSLNFQGITVHHGRAEELTAKVYFDCVVSRAFADLDTFLQTGSELTRNGGLLIAMKSKKIETELDKSREIQKKNRLLLVEQKFLTLPYAAGERSVLVFKKNVSRETFI